MNIQKILETYNVDSHRGFLPKEDPLLALPSEFAAWDNLALNLTDYINAGIVREKIEELPLIENIKLKGIAEEERAMMLLAFFAHAYVHCPPVSRNYIPKNIAIPWTKITSKINRKPILSHSTNVLYNWKRLDTNRPLHISNLATLCQFHGGLDESWFYLITVEIENVGAKAISLVLEAMKYSALKDFDNATLSLEKANPILAALTTTLKRMYEKCDPHIFYLRIRPFLASFENIEFKGCNLEPQNFHGGSAAQSSLLQFFDAAFGIEYENPSTKKYLHLMRHHMPCRHADFLKFVESSTTIRSNISKNKSLEKVYNVSIQHLIEFRNEHLKMVAMYIMQQAKRTNSTAIGTGGTNPMSFLKSVRNQNEEIKTK